MRFFKRNSSKKIMRLGIFMFEYIRKKKKQNGMKSIPISSMLFRLAGLFSNAQWVKFTDQFVEIMHISQISRKLE